MLMEFRAYLSDGAPRVMCCATDFLNFFRGLHIGLARYVNEKHAICNCCTPSKSRIELYERCIHVDKCKCIRMCRIWSLPSSYLDILNSSNLHCTITTHRARKSN